MFLAPRGLGHDGGLGDALVFAERTLDLERADPVARGEDNVVSTPLEPEVAVFVFMREVAREVPLAVGTVDETRCRLLRLVPVLGKEAGVVSTLGDLAGLAGLEYFARFESTMSASIPGSGLPIEPGGPPSSGSC